MIMVIIIIIIIIDDDDDEDDDDNRIEITNARFSTISSLPRELSPTRTLKCPEHNRVQITCNTQSAHHAQHASRVPLGTVQVHQMYQSFVLLC